MKRNILPVIILSTLLVAVSGLSRGAADKLTYITAYAETDTCDSESDAGSLTDYPTLIDYASSLDAVRAHGEEISDIFAPQGSIVTDAATGQVLWAENIDVVWTPASMSKLMTITLAYDAVHDGKFTLDTETEVTDRYVAISQKYQLSNNVMIKGCKYTVGELIDLICVPSSAAATYMLFEMIEPDIDTYVQMMNDKAKELGMTETEYVNPVGVENRYLDEFAPTLTPPEADNYTSCRDYALLCTYLVNNYPDIYNHTSQFVKVVKEGTPYEETFTGYNNSLPGGKYPFEGVDGLKTGSAGFGYNHSVTCKRGDMRLVQIILGVATWDVTEGETVRHIIGNALLQEAFDKYEYRKILEKGEYEANGKKVEVIDDLYDCVPKDQEIKFRWDLEKLTVTADLERGYLPGYSAPTSKIEIKSPAAPPATKGGAGALIIAAVAAALVVIIRWCTARRKTAAGRRRRRR